MNDALREATPTLLIGCGQMGKYYVGCLFGQLGFKEGEVIAYDQSPEKRIKFTEEFPQALTVSSMEAALELKPKTAFVLVNSPEHLPVIHRLLDAGITNILVEKPLVLTAQLEQLLQHPRIKEVNLVTAYLISFSLAVQKLMQFMQERNLVVGEGRGLWGKNRIGDSRPTAGDWEDEATHPLCTIVQLVKLNQHIEGFFVTAQFSRVPYTNKAVQQLAVEQDPSYESDPVATSCAAIDILTGERAVLATINSSFVSMEQERRIEVVLACWGDDSRQIAYLARIDFDVVNEDRLHVWSGVRGENITSERFTDVFDKKVKLQHQIEAFLRLAAGGGKDPRLVDLDDAGQLIKISQAALQSDKEAVSVCIKEY